MRILLIKPKHIGDSLLLTPTITAIKTAYPEAKIWVMVRRGCEGILAGCPDIEEILTLAGVEKSDRKPGDLWRQLKILCRLWSVKFDYVFELGDGHRARLFAMLCRARRRYSVKTSSPLTRLERRRFTAVSSFDWQTCHRVEKDYHSVSEFLPLPRPIPALRFEREFAQSWKPGEGLTNFCVMQIGKRQGLSRWHRQGWEEVGRQLLERFSAVVIVSGPADYEVEEAAWLKERLGPRVLCTLGRASWPQVAGLLYRARLYVGLDTAAMHLAAACQCPVVALFGPSIEDHWHPWQAPYRIVTSRGYVPAEDAEERYARVKKRTMNEIEAREVMAACEELLNETGAS
jgi:lipopolysaccharide heptosyltransferase III